MARIYIFIIILTVPITTNCSKQNTVTPGSAKTAQITNPISTLLLFPAEVNPTDAASIAKYCRKCIANNDVAGALKSAHQALQLNPQAGQYHALLGDVHALMHNWGYAMQKWNDALDLDATLYQTQAQLGATLLREASDPSGVKMTQQALAKMPEDAWIWMYHGIALLYMMQWEEGKEALQKSLELNPHLAQAHYELSRVFAKEGKLAAALQAAQQAVEFLSGSYEYMRNFAVLQALSGNHAEAIAVLQKALKLNIRDSECYALLLWLHLELEQPTEAAKWLQTYEIKNSRFFDVIQRGFHRYELMEKLNQLAKRIHKQLQDESGNADHLLSGALFMILIGRYYAALDLLHELFELNPKDSLPLRLTAMIYQYQKENNLAQKFLQQAYEIDSADPLNQIFLGIFNAENHDHAQAIHYYQQALQKNPNNALIKCRLGYSLMEQENWTAAQNMLEQARAAEPTLTYCRNRLGYVYAKQKEWQKSVDVLREALQTRTWDEDSLNTMGWVLVQANNNQDALIMLTALTHMENPSHAYFKNRAEAYWAMQKLDLANADFEMALSIDATSTWVRERYARFLFAQNKIEQAIEEIKQCLKIEPNNRDYANLLARFQAKMRN